MDQRSTVQSVISHINMAKREIENFPRSGLSKKSITELDQAHKSLNESINHCTIAMQNL
ncbi:MAG: hypothetical protein ACOX0N_11605 [Syntrophomonadaceae bacterium]|jgi:prefoldin subunit 5|nr:hypothetical protein [Syntrophomonadaceae bacterium]